jgi:hypothetical protein
MPSQHCRFVEGWKALMPDYRFVFWSEDNAPMEREYLQNAHRGRRWVNLANFIRLYSVFNEGGIYLDTDVEVIRPFDPLLAASRCFLGYQVADRDHPGNSVNNAIFGAEKKHPFAGKMLEAVESLYDGLETEYLSGPALSTFMLRTHGLLGSAATGDPADVRIYPHRYFYPYSWLEAYDPACITEDTFAVHHWFGSWSEPDPSRSRFAAVLTAIRRRVRSGGGAA